MEDNEQEEANGRGSGTQGADSVAEGCSAIPGPGEEDKTHVCYYCVMQYQYNIIIAIPAPLLHACIYMHR